MSRGEARIRFAAATRRCPRVPLPTIWFYSIQQLKRYEKYFNLNLYEACEDFLCVTKNVLRTKKVVLFQYIKKDRPLQSLEKQDQQEVQELKEGINSSLLYFTIKK